MKTSLRHKFEVLTEGIDYFNWCSINSNGIVFCIGDKVIVKNSNFKITYEILGLEYYEYLQQVRALLGYGDLVEVFFNLDSIEHINY